MSLINLCSCTLMKDHKMRQIINDLYPPFSRIMNLASFLSRQIIFEIVPPLLLFSKRFLISIFFPSGEGGHPLPVPPPPSSPLRASNEGFALVHYNSHPSPPPPPPGSTKSWGTELLYGILTEIQNNYTKIG